MRKVASTRWSKMLGCKESRIGHDNGMRAFLGERNWRAFVSYAETQYKSEYKDAFCPDMYLLAGLRLRIECVYPKTVSYEHAHMHAAGSLPREPRAFSVVQNLFKFVKSWLTLVV